MGYNKAFDQTRKAPMFKPLAASTLTKDEVIGVLLDIQSRGWEICEDTPNRQYLIQITDDDFTRVVFLSEGVWGVSQWFRKGYPSYMPMKCHNLTDLRTQLQAYLGGPPPTQVRLVKDQPASNIAKLAALVGNRKVLAVFDPYYDDAGLGTLLAIGHLKPCVDTSLRILTDKNPPRINKTFAKAFCDEFGCDLAKIRHMPKGEHRRFLLLSEDKVLILGCSLNNLNFNEAVRLESDGTDKPFFETQWSPSTAMPW
jgi:hypothetical protein